MEKNSKFEARNSKGLAREARARISKRSTLNHAVVHSPISNLTVLIRMKMGGLCRFAPF